MCFSLSDGSQQLRGEPQEKLLKVRGEMRSFPHWRMLGGALWKLGMPTMLKRSLLPFCLLRTWDATWKPDVFCVERAPLVRHQVIYNIFILRVIFCPLGSQHAQFITVGICPIRTFCLIMLFLTSYLCACVFTHPCACMWRPEKDARLPLYHSPPFPLGQVSQ